MNPSEHADLIKITLDLWALDEETILIALRADQIGDTVTEPVTLPQTCVDDIKEKAVACRINPELALGLIIMNNVYRCYSEMFGEEGEQ